MKRPQWPARAGRVKASTNQEILTDTLGLQEAKDSSEIENIVTTPDELFKGDVLPEAFANPAAKEVLRYRQALRVGFEQVRSSGLITANHIVQVQAELERNNAGFRKLPGPALKDGAGRTAYTPPQDPAETVAPMSGLERFINDSENFAAAATTTSIWRSLRFCRARTSAQHRAPDPLTKPANAPACPPGCSIICALTAGGTASAPRQAHPRRHNDNQNGTTPLCLSTRRAPACPPFPQPPLPRPNPPPRCIASCAPAT
nr:Fic/DOC family N-terminal domain-containing protein [Variovorax sp. dw_954]